MVKIRININPIATCYPEYLVKVEHLLHLAESLMLLHFVRTYKFNAYKFNAYKFSAYRIYTAWT